ncbi:MAG: non-canonical purine NTP pyrophosphatase [Bacteriovoracaceae bacterium]|nr:non-canonical purine NTP pyrophosphatase [Bacteriovoracaceae bacterium]
MLSFILASGNAHKAEEFSELFKDKIVVKAAPRGLSPDETGETFTANALIKAKAYYDEFQLPSLADDSGLTVESLPQILGVQSARFLPERADYKEKCLEIIRLLQTHENKRAYFTCVLCFYISPSEIYFFEGRVHGEIGNEYRGDKGFGYDPIFIPQRAENDGKTLAELPEWKNLNSHRAKASLAALDFFISR